MARAARKTNKDETASIVDRVQNDVRLRLSAFAIKPGERINESELAVELGVSRTPLREALNRLCTEGFLRLDAGRGFFGRALDAKEVFDLYELRDAIECAAIVHSVERASDTEIAKIEAFLVETGPAAAGRSTRELVTLDEEFHTRLIALSGNHALADVLRNVNDRIRFVRWIDMDRRGRPVTQSEHRAIIEAMKRRDAQACRDLLHQHIHKRMDEIVGAVREGFGRIYVEDSTAS